MNEIDSVLLKVKKPDNKIGQVKYSKTVPATMREKAKEFIFAIDREALAPRKKPKVAPTAPVTESVAPRKRPQLSDEPMHIQKTMKFIDEVKQERKEKQIKEEKRKNDTADILEKVTKLATDMSEKAKALGVKGNKPYKGRADDIKKVKTLFKEWEEAGGREPSFFSSALEPYTMEGARGGARTFKYTDKYD